MNRSTLDAEHGRASRLWLLRPGCRELWHENPAGSDGRFVVRYGGKVEQSGVRRASSRLGAVRQCGPVRVHILVVADALEAAYADRCQTAGAGAWT